MTPCAERNIIAVNADEKIAFCPAFSAARLVAIFNEASSYFAKDLSYCWVSYFSLLKYYGNVGQNLSLILDTV